MRALTLTQPWATLWLALDLRTRRRWKQIESRSWCVAGARGKRLGVHSAGGIKSYLRKAISNGTVFHRPYAEALVACGYAPLDPFNPLYRANLLRLNDSLADEGNPPLKAMELGAMLGAVTIADIIPGSAVLYRIEHGGIDPIEAKLGHYDESEGKRYGWLSMTPRTMPEPTYCRGFQQLWEIPRDVEEDMRNAGVA